MEPLFDLSTFEFTPLSDVVDLEQTIINLISSDINTLEGNDQIIGNVSIVGDFGFQEIAKVEAEGLDSVMNSSFNSINSFMDQANVDGDGIINRGIISTNEGSDLLQGIASANLSATAEAVAEAVAVVKNFSASAIANAFASIDFQATADGIDNVGGIINTNSGNDNIGSSIIGSISAIATATADATAIVEAIATMPMSESLVAFAEAVALSLAQATIVARGINNKQGQIYTGLGKDTISSTANTSTISITDSVTSTLAIVPEENAALAQASASAFADAFAEATAQAIAIDNSYGLIDTGEDDDSIIATSNSTATDTNDTNEVPISTGSSIAIDNTEGLISTGNGNDSIIAQGKDEPLSYGILGGQIFTGAGEDTVIASKFGGKVEIYTGGGNDYVEGFGSAALFGGNGFDAVNLTISKEIDLDSINIAGQNAFFSLDGMLLRTSDFEQFTFANGQTYSIDNLPFLGSDNRDLFQGRETSDFMFLRGGNDVALGNAGADEILAEEGNDIIWGGSGKDTLRGGTGDDLLYGGSGDDIIDSGLGRDIMKGEAGSDRFIVSGLAAERDIIFDYEVGVDELTLTDGLTFERITVNQVGHNATIDDAQTHETYAILLGVNASHINAGEFV